MEHSKLFIFQMSSSGLAETRFPGKAQPPRQCVDDRKTPMVPFFFKRF